MKFLLLIFLILFLFSCDRGSGEEFICGTGKRVSCNCEDGQSGLKQCKNNEWQACVCQPDNRCEGVSCSGNGECVIKDQAVTCECKDGYHSKGLNCIKDGELDPCKDKTCVDNSHCTVENDIAKCICDDKYIETGGVCKFDCTHLEYSHANEANNACDCNDGYHLEDGLCKENDDFKCLNYTCDDTNSHCIVKNDEASCVCDTGFVEINNICTLNCDSLDNSHSNAENTKCICNDGFHLEDELCLENEKKVSCKDITLPENSHQITSLVSIFWDEATGWSVAEDCSWECNLDYQDIDNNQTCLPSCTASSCENGTCDDSSGKIDCTCNDGYQDKDNDELCLPDCNSTKVESVACGGYGTCHDDTGVVICVCDEGYQDNDNDGSCKPKCHIDILRPELGTCGKYGSCSDASGEVTCSCENGYFVNPNTGKCTAPCEGVDCGGHGTCLAIGINSISCDCHFGYQDYDSDLICKKSCQSNCSENASSCDDSSGELSCDCSNAYQDNDRDGTCLSDCSTVLCNESKQVLNSCNDNSGFPVCLYQTGYNYTTLIKGTNTQTVNDSVVDSNGNLYIVGGFKGEVDFDISSGTDIRMSSGEEDIFITRLNADGSYAWTYIIGAGSVDAATNVAVDNYDNLYVTGYFSSRVDFNPVNGGNFYEPMQSEGLRDIFILKITSSGEYDWSKSFGSSNTDEVTSIKLDSSSVYLTGEFQGDIDFNRAGNGGEFAIRGKKDGFIAKFGINDASYNWAKTFGAENKYNTVKDLVILNNNIYITGQFNGSIDFNFGYTPEVISTNSYQAFILKASKDGTFSWVKEFKSVGIGWSKGLFLENKDNNIYIAGIITGNVDFDLVEETEDILNAGEFTSIFISKITEAGQVLDKEIFIATVAPAELKDIKLYNNSIYLTGNFKGSLSFQANVLNNTSMNNIYSDIFKVKLDSNFIASNLVKIGGNLDKSSKSISINETGGLYLLGTFENSLDFDPSSSEDIKEAQDLKDIFISRYTE